MVPQVKDPVFRITAVARVSAVLWVRSLAPELPHAVDAAKKKEKKKRDRLI